MTFIKRGNISIVLLVSLIVLMGDSAIIVVGVNSKFTAKQSYGRIANRYIAESGIDTAIGLFEEHISAQDFVITYTQNPDGSFNLIDEYSPYLLDEIWQSINAETVDIERVSAESADYLASIGFIEFKRTSGVQIAVKTFHQKEKFKLSQMCIESGFSVSQGAETGSVSSRINPVYLTVKSRYKGGEVLCNAEISDIYLVREPFVSGGIGELANVRARIDAGKSKITYKTYQNYRNGGGGF